MRDSVAPREPAPAYAVQPDTLWYESANPFRLYWVRGQDSLGWGGANAGAEAHVWSERADTLRVEVTEFTLDAARREDADTFAVSRAGRVLDIRGPGARPDGRWDLLLPLPDDGRLVAGATWRDSLARTWSDEHGAHLYSVARSLEVREVLDTVGARLARVHAESEVALRSAFVVDSASSVVTTIDVRGPAQETFLFDLAAGRLVERTWAMHLRGSGTIDVPGEAVDTVPAGLISEFTLAASTPERVRRLARPLPGADTTYTVSYLDEAVVTHTAGITPDGVVGGWAAPSGEVSSGPLTLDWPTPTRLSWLLTEPLQPDLGVDLLAAPSGPKNTAGDVAHPPDAAEAWAFWLDGHEELLVPMALTLPVDSVPRMVALWDVEAARWLEAEALVLDLEGHTLCVVTPRQELPVVSIIVAPDGELLYAELGAEAERAPAAGTAKRDFVEGLIRRFTGGRERRRDTGRRS